MTSSGIGKYGIFWQPPKVVGAQVARGLGGSSVDPPAQLEVPRVHGAIQGTRGASPSNELPSIQNRVEVPGYMGWSSHLGWEAASHHGAGFPHGSCLLS